MVENPKLSKELSEYIQVQRKSIEELINLINLLIATIIGKKPFSLYRNEDKLIPKEIKSILPVMLQAVGSSSNTILSLSEEPGFQTRDCYSIIRSIVELSINICYIIAEGPTAADDAIRHSKQKSFRDLKRDIKIGKSVISLKYSSIPDISEIEDLENDIKKFSTANGKEKGWTDLSLDDRIIIVEKKLGQPEAMDLAFARFMIYRHSSEVLHGTLFGIMHFAGQTLPKKIDSTEKLIENFGDQLMLILMANIASITSIFESFHKAYGYQKLMDQQAIIMKNIKQISKLNK